jgi:hypothetical protein
MKNTTVDGSMADKSRPPLRPPLSIRNLSAQQRWLVDLMREHQFGRIENISIREGQPILDRDVKVVRVTRLGGKSDMPEISGTAEFELKKQFRDLFDELARLGNGGVIRLQFRHGLPCLLETLAV